jgi:hypothetical protein
MLVWRTVGCLSASPASFGRVWPATEQPGPTWKQYGGREGGPYFRRCLEQGSFQRVMRSSQARVLVKRKERGAGVAYCRMSFRVSKTLWSRLACN